MEKKVLKELNSVQVIDARPAKLSDYSYPITKSSNWTAVIGYPRDRATITQQIGARRTNHEQAFCYRYDYYFYNYFYSYYYFIVIFALEDQGLHEELLIQQI